MKQIHSVFPSDWPQQKKPAFVKMNFTVLVFDSIMPASINETWSSQENKSNLPRVDAASGTVASSR
ncbi:hypothetical protein JNB91_14890 [Rhizobium wenxiniae]|uniref:hypothetical protein n=1 Tax=Rhizobium wenxiniae TaxID=1737357 RepID=UPI001C6EB559|nr:hypothetical protein [Rhizobium wenxiniae]MBW9089122.1 hypothetical protein [Rhizobium wenxiniae]